jgi:hypothetical protein
VADCWTGKEKVRAVYLTDDVRRGHLLLDDAIAWCAAPESGLELRTLGKALRRWARGDPGASHDQRVERSGRGRQPPRQAGQALRSGLPERPELQAPDPARRRRLTPV